MKTTNLKRAVLPFIPLTLFAEAVVVEPHYSGWHSQYLGVVERLLLF